MSREREERRAGNQSADLGARLRSLIRRETNLQRLAAKAGVSAATLYEWLGGRREPSLTNAKKLAAALNVSLEWLATGKGVRVPERVTQQGEALQLAKEEEMELIGELRRMRSAIERLAQSYRSLVKGQTQLVAVLRARRRPQGKKRATHRLALKRLGSHTTAGTLQKLSARHSGSSNKNRGGAA